MHKDLKVNKINERESMSPIKKPKRLGFEKSSGAESLSESESQISDCSGLYDQKNQSINSLDE